METTHQVTKAGLAVTFVGLSAFAVHLINNEFYLPGSVTVANNNSLITNEIEICPQLGDNPEVIKSLDKTIEKIRNIDADGEH